MTPDHPTGVYDTGEPICWTIKWDGENAPDTISYTLKSNGLKEVGQGSVPLNDGEGVLQTTLEEPGAILAEIKTTGSDGRERTAFGGAIADPEKIEPSVPRPDDFDAFWDDKIHELQAVPVNAKLDADESGVANIDYYKVTMDNIRGTRIYGQLARPSEGESFPAMLVVQWAGVYGLEKGWVTDRAKDGWLVLNIEPHELPIDQPRSFYQEQSDGPLKDYGSIGIEDRETSYFLRMYLSCYRAADYLANRPDWNGETLVVIGGSQGGQQALVTAALYPGITAAMAGVPAGCDALGPEAGRAPGWPMWYWNTGDTDPEQAHQAIRYFDVVNFAPRIDCPVLVSAGLIDRICPPAGILSAFNKIEAPKEIVFLPNGDHSGRNNSERAYYQRLDAWLPALAQGERPPVQDLAQTVAE